MYTHTFTYTNPALHYVQEKESKLSWSQISFFFFQNTESEATSAWGSTKSLWVHYIFVACPPVFCLSLWIAFAQMEKHSRGCCSSSVCNLLSELRESKHEDNGGRNEEHTGRLRRLTMSEELATETQALAGPTWMLCDCKPKEKSQGMCL